MDPLLFDYGVIMTHELDSFFGVPRKQVMSQRDVPGTTRAVIPLLTRKGVKGLTIGCNDGSASPAGVMVNLMSEINFVLLFLVFIVFIVVRCLLSFLLPCW
jgi:hypothetical protein